MFRVLLTSPEGAVMGGVSEAQVTIGRSGSGTGGRDALGPARLGRTAHRSPDGDNVSTAGGCPLNQGQRGQQGQQGPVLGGQEIPSDSYPQHGSIQLETLPLGTGSLVWTRGDGVPRPSEDATGPKVRVLGGPRVVSVAAGGCPPGLRSSNPAWSKWACSDPAGAPFLRVPQRDRRRLQGEPTAPADLLDRLLDLTVSASPPLQYHAITQVQVDDDRTPSRQGRKARVHVRPGPGPGPAPGPASERSPGRASVEVTFRSSLGCRGG